ncbi:hypothetical protein D3C71_1483500 [compost metagenome]
MHEDGIGVSALAQAWVSIRPVEHHQATRVLGAKQVHLLGFPIESKADPALGEQLVAEKIALHCPSKASREHRESNGIEQRDQCRGSNQNRSIRTMPGRVKKNDVQPSTGDKTPRHPVAPPPKQRGDAPDVVAPSPYLKPFVVPGMQQALVVCPLHDSFVPIVGLSALKLLSSEQASSLFCLFDRFIRGMSAPQSKLFRGQFFRCFIVDFFEPVHHSSVTLKAMYRAASSSPTFS